LTANTISASTYFNLPIDVFVTGATYSNGSATFTNNIGGTFILSGLTTPFTGGTVPGPIDCTGGLTASTISAGTYQNLPIDVFVTGGTYSLGTAIFTNNTGGTFTVTGFSNTFTGGTVTGATNFTNGLTANTISATTYLNLPVDVFVTGGTYSAGTATFTNNTGGTFTVTGFDSQDLYITGGTFDKNTETLTFTNNTGGTVAITGFTDIFVTGATYNDGSATFTNNTGGTFVLSGLTTPFTGGTVSGDTIFLSGLTANTISASTYLNLPIDVFVTGGTYSAGTATFTNNTGGTFTVTGFDSQDLYITGGTFDKNTETLTLTNNTGGTVVVTGFTDVYVTGATYLNGSATFTNNSGTTFTLTGLTTPFTGGTVSGDTIFLNGLTANTISAATYQNLPGGLLYFVSTSTPTATQSGDRWFNLNTGVEVVWIEDGDSNQWVQPFSVPGPLSPDAGYYQTTGITSSQTLSWNYTYWGISASTNVDLILPTTTSKNGYYIIIKDESGNCGSYRIRVTPASGLIDGNNYIDMNINYMSLTFIVRNGNWYLI
jgi:hypothetical protein